MAVQNPYISINRLAEYATASSSLRRRNIIVALKADKPVLQQYYSEVHNLVPGFFKSNCNSEFFIDHIDRIKRKTIITKWDKDDANNSILAMQCLMGLNYPKLDIYDIVTHSPKLDFLKWNGVKVTIKPDLYLRNKSNGKMGAIKVNLSKTIANRLTDKSREYVTSTIKFGFLEKGFESRQVDNNACLSFEIFGKEHSCAPSAHVSRIRHLQACCEEIAQRWDSI